jgi:hypothetical protein
MLERADNLMSNMTWCLHWHVCQGSSRYFLLWCTLRRSVPEQNNMEMAMSKVLWFLVPRFFMHQSGEQ